MIKIMFKDTYEDLIRELNKQDAQIDMLVAANVKLTKKIKKLEEMKDVRKVTTSTKGTKSTKKSKK